MDPEVIVMFVLMVLAAAFIAYVAHDQRTRWLPTRARSDALRKERIGKKL